MWVKRCYMNSCEGNSEEKHVPLFLKKNTFKEIHYLKDKRNSLFACDRRKPFKILSS